MKQLDGMQQGWLAISLSREQVVSLMRGDSVSIREDGNEIHLSGRVVNDSDEEFLVFVDRINDDNKELAEALRIIMLRAEMGIGSGLTKQEALSLIRQEARDALHQTKFLTDDEAFPEET